MAHEALRVLHVASAMAGSYFPDLLGRISQDGFQVSCASLTAIPPTVAADLTHRGVSILTLPSASTRVHFPEITWRLIKFVRRHRIDIIHLHHFDASVLGIISSLARSRSCSIVTRHHSDAHHLLRKRWHVYLDRTVASLADQIVAVSESTRDVLVNDERIPQSKVRVIYNGIDTTRFRSVSVTAAAAIRDSLGVSDRFVITVPARLYELKGHSYLISALPQILNAAGTKVMLLLAGAGREEARLRGQVETHGLDKYVRFLGYRSDMPQVLAASDLVVLPSLTETFGLVVVEAMAAGKPVVATTVGGIPELVDHGRTGLLVPPRSSAALADAILTLMGDPARCAAMGAAGTDRAEDFTLEMMARSYTACYLALAGGRPHCPAR